MGGYFLPNDHRQRLTAFLKAVAAKPADGRDKCAFGETAADAVRDIRQSVLSGPALGAPAAIVSMAPASRIASAPGSCTQRAVKKVIFFAITSCGKRRSIIYASASCFHSAHYGITEYGLGKAVLNMLASLS